MTTISLKPLWLRLQGYHATFVGKRKLAKTAGRSTNDWFDILDETDKLAIGEHAKIIKPRLDVILSMINVSPYPSPFTDHALEVYTRNVIRLSHDSHVSAFHCIANLCDVDTRGNEDKAQAVRSTATKMFADIIEQVVTPLFQKHEMEQVLAYLLTFRRRYAPGHPFRDGADAQLEKHFKVKAGEPQHSASIRAISVAHGLLPCPSNSPFEMILCPEKAENLLPHPG